MDDIAVLLRRLAAAADAFDSDLIEEAAHGIKEIANQIDAEDLKTAAFKTELAIRRGNVQEAREHIAKLKDTFNTYRKRQRTPKGGKKA